MPFSIDLKSTQGFIFRNWPVCIFPQEIKSPLDGVLSASCIFPFQNSIKGFTSGIPVVGGEHSIQRPVANDVRHSCWKSCE